MGQIANDIINGFQCSWCGICFEKAHGHPVLCDDCFRDSTKKERDGLPKATEKEL